MHSIQPCRSQISDRFPVASFNIELPRTRYFEVACATDPRLFHVDWQRHRTPSNFFTTRRTGLLHAAQGRTAWILPPDQLRRFAGARRVYYALGSYGSPAGGEPRFSISPHALDRIPSIALSPDFSGRSLDATRLGGHHGGRSYGSPGQSGIRHTGLRWGGDEVLEAELVVEESPQDEEYDDGHSPDLWNQDGDLESPPPSSGPPSNGAPVNGAPANGAPANGAPVNGAPRTGVPGNGPPANGAPANGAPTEAYPGTRVPERADGGNGKPLTAGGPDQIDVTADMSAYDEGIWAEAGLEEAELVDAAVQGYEDAADLYGAVGFESPEVAVIPPASAPAPGGPTMPGPGSNNAAGSDLVEAEPPGVGDVEDAPQAAPPAPHDDSTLAQNGDTAVPPAPSPSNGPGPGRDPAYKETQGTAPPTPLTPSPSPETPGTSPGVSPGSAPVAPSESPSAGTATLDIPEKVRLLRVIARAESGDDGYAAVNPDSEYNEPGHPAYQQYHIGLSWGLIQFTQRSGALGRVLEAAKRREELLTELPTEQRFESVFGPASEELIRVTNAGTPEERVGPVAGANLWDPVWTERFRAAGAIPHFTWAQNEVAITDYFDPQLRYAKWLGFDTPKALAMLVDRAVHMGDAGGLDWVMRAVGPVQNEADQATALAALGQPDLRSFQAMFAPDLPVDGIWGPATHAAMTFALRGLGGGSPIPVADRETMLERLAAAAANNGFAARVQSLYTNTADFAGDVSYALV